jgi:DNA polymerase-3 subunit delta
MVLFLYGSDTFRSKRKLNEIIEKYHSKYKSGLNFIELDANEDGFDELKKRIETISMFKEKKLIIFKSVFSTPKSFQQKIEKYLIEKDLFGKKDLFLIFFEEGEIKNKSTLSKLLFQKSFKKQEFKELPLLKVREFVKKEVKNLGGEISKPAVDKLISYYENNLWQIENELKKLVTFKQNKAIEGKDVENLCEANLNPSIFKTIEAISKKDKKEALKLISEHLECGENEIRILSMINYQFRNLMKIKSLLKEKKTIYQIQRTSGLHPFVVKKTLPLAQNFSMEELKNIYQKLLELDLSIKTGKIEPKIGIEMFVMEL